MLKWLTYSLFFCCGLAAGAQRNVQTVVPVQPIAVGTAFQVQYIVSGSEAAIELQSPAFGRDFRFVSGPRLYQGQASINNRSVPIQNFSYTLIPLRKGRLVIKGATAIFKDGKEASDASYVRVTDAPAASATPSAPLPNLPKLAAGANWEAALHRQLFIKTAISRQTCFIGEPVEVTFTLFSRLPSASEVIKNPGFYGFSVLDKPDASAGQQTIQTHNGAFYNTQILRQVQLYPAQAGNLVIDKISVSAAIEYTDSASGAPVQKAVLLESEPLPVTVKPLPTAPETFTGAVGAFGITAQTDEQTWPQNRSGQLQVTVKGAGNFVQLSAPEIAWPKGLDVFEPKTTERLQKETTPVAGARTYTYTFTADSAGAYSIAPIAYTYFNPKQKKFETVFTDSIRFTVKRPTARTAIGQKLRAISAQPRSFLPFLVVLLLALGAGLFLLFRKRFPTKGITHTARKPNAPDYAQRIRAIAPDDAFAYRQLQQALMGFLKSLPAAEATLNAGRIQPVSLPVKGQTAQAILDECEAVQYFNAQPAIPFRQLQQQALDLVQSAHI